MDTKKLGRLGEDIVCEYLKKKGYQILERNYIKVWDDKTKGEIDIVARKKWSFLKFLKNKNDKTIHFIEVKTVDSNSKFFPEEKVDYRKQEKIKKLAETWLLAHQIPLDSKWQIDVAGVLVNDEREKIKIRYFKNVVSEGLTRGFF